MALAEVCVGVGEDICTFAGSVADEQTWAFCEIFCKTGLVHYDRSGLDNLLHAVEGVAGGCVCLVGYIFEDSGIDLHAACIDHRDDVSEILHLSVIPGLTGNLFTKIMKLPITLYENFVSLRDFRHLSFRANEESRGIF